MALRSQVPGDRRLGPSEPDSRHSIEKARNHEPSRSDCPVGSPVNLHRCVGASMRMPHTNHRLTVAALLALICLSGLLSCPGPAWARTPTPTPTKKPTPTPTQTPTPTPTK